MSDDRQNKSAPILPNYPSNSNKKKEAVEEEKRVEKVVKGEVKKKKRSLGRKFSDAFSEEDRQSVGDHILYDVLIPAAKNTISDMVKGGIDMFLFGGKGGSRTTRDRGRSYVSYNDYYGGRGSAQHRPRQQISPRARARHDFDDIVLADRGEAEQVLSLLVDLVVDYGQATVADLYDLVGITSNFTDNKYGWVNLSRASVVRVRDGYLIQLPRTEVLD